MEELENETVLLLHLPGGGFVALPPEHHEAYIIPIAKETTYPIISVDYRKSPEFKYPCAIHDCFDVYKELVNTNGACIGIKMKRKKKLKATKDILSFDSFFLIQTFFMGLCP